MTLDEKIKEEKSKSFWKGIFLGNAVIVASFGAGYLGSAFFKGNSSSSNPSMTSPSTPGIGATQMIEEMNDMHAKQLVSLNNPTKSHDDYPVFFREDATIKDSSTFNPEPYIGENLGSFAYIQDVDRNGINDVVLVNNTYVESTNSVVSFSSIGGIWTDIFDRRDDQNRTVKYSRRAFFPAENLEQTQSENKDYLMGKTEVTVLYDAAEN